MTDPLHSHETRIVASSTPPVGENTGPTDAWGRTLSSWPKRLAAHLLDLALFLVPLAAAAFVTGRLVTSTGAEGEDFFHLALLARGMLAGTFGWSLLIYTVVLHGGERGQTLGKRLMGIQVRDADTGGRLGYRKAFLRALVQVLLGFLTRTIGMALDGLWPLWDKRRQTLHDKACGSIVVDLPRTPQH